MNASAVDSAVSRVREREPLLVVAIVLLGCLAVPVARTQEPAKSGPASAPEPPLYDQPPFDVIVLDEANANARLKVLPLDLPQRRPQSVAAETRLRIRLVDDEDDEYEVSGRNIRSLELYEEMLLNEGNRLVNQSLERVDGKPKPAVESARLLAQAFLHFDRVQQSDPDFPGLKTAVHRNLFFDAVNLNVQERHAEAFAVLEELYHRDPQFRLTATSRSLPDVMSILLNSILTRYFNDRNLVGMRILMQRVAGRYGNLKLAAVDTWVAELSKLAAEKRDLGRQQLDKQRYRDAFTSVQEMKSIWPDVDGGRELSEDVAAAYPMVFVGVTQPALEHDAERLDNWGARRTGRLVHRTLVEFLGAGPEGGQYQLSFGSIDHSEDRRQLILRLDPSARTETASVTGYDVSHRLLQLATPDAPDCVPAWASLLSGVEVRNVYTVTANLRRPHVLPEAFLRVRLARSMPADPALDSGDGPFRVQSRTDAEIQFAQKSFASGSPLAEIVERTYDESQPGLAALRRGEIDVLDRVFPADALRARADASATSPIRIEPYSLPTVHLLVPNLDNPFLANRDFRRALLLAVNREQILRQEILGDRDYPGFQVVSGPFPARAGNADPLGYGYDESIRPMPYSPHLARILILIASDAVAKMARQRGEPAPELSRLVVGFPGHELARVASQAIADQLRSVGLPIELREFPPGISEDTQGDCDLVYKEVALWEPVTDAGRMLGPRGMAPTRSPYVQLSLRWLDEAENWGEARERLIDIHRAVDDDVALLPLWQTVDFFAFHKRLNHIGANPVWLYQHVDLWRIGGERGAE